MIKETIARAQEEVTSPKKEHEVYCGKHARRKGPLLLNPANFPFIPERVSYISQKPKIVSI